MPDGRLLYDPKSRDFLAWQIRHGPYSMTERSSKDITDFFFGPVKSGWRLVKGVYRWITGRAKPLHKSKRGVALNPRGYKRIVRKLRALGPKK